ncbi:MAG: hypothetical protein WCR96_02255 [Candidatus Methanomethylophilaceae archaeon]|jgi:hypothetical protein
MILSGNKKEEYREIKPYWSKRFDGKSYDLVTFRNGYHKDSPVFTVKLLGIDIGYGNPLWGAKEEKVYILKLGEVYV